MARLGPDRSPEQAPAQLTFDGVSKTYRSRQGDVPALIGIDLAVREGELVVILGPSGCGKSTLLKMTAGIVRPTEGKIIVGSNVVVPKDPPAGHLGMVFQTPVLLEWRTVLDNILLPIEILGGDRRAGRDRAEELLVRVGLEGFQDRHPAELSGGMQQRVAICRALVFDPPILLMDEPFGALDALTRDEMAVELLRLWEATRKTILFVTHSIEESVFLADRVVVLSARPGRIKLDVTIDLERPRDAETRYHHDFSAYSHTIREAITTQEPLPT
ncbi:MAG: ABC transporter ATP-binding protein [Acidimicrobiia bacterium]